MDKIFGNINATDEQVKKVYNLFKKTGSSNYAKEKAINYSNNAKQALSIFPDSNAKQILISIADYSINRKK